MDRAANAEVRRLLERAAALDPSLARAWALLAHAYFDAAFYGWTDNPAEMWRLFHHAAQKAVELDFTDAHAQVVLGMSHAKRGRARAGAEAWERAVAQGPSDALVVRAVAVNLPIACGIERAAEAVELAERALLRLDPLHPSWQWASLGTPLYFAGRYAEAAAAFEKVGKHWVETRLMLAISYAQIGEQAKAAQQAAELIKLEPGFTAEAWVDNDLYQAGSSSAVVLIEGARKARLPICAMSPTAPGKSGYAAPAEVRRGAGEGDRREDLTGAGDRLPT
jgi:tetratricopeptide (TPR) repeat protein